MDFMGAYLWLKEEQKKNVKELKGPTLHHGRILYYHSFTTLDAKTDEIAWCASTVCAALENAGFVSTRSALAKSYLGYGQAGKGQKGEIVILKTPSSYHVGFVDQDFKKGDKIVYVLGGNQKDALNVSVFKASSIVEFRVPC